MADYYIGLLSGTSVDAVDAALVAFDGDHPQLIATHAHPIPAGLRDAVAALCEPGGGEIDRLGEVDVAMGELFAEAVLTLLRQAGLDGQTIVAIGSHGQTVRHRPQASHPFTLQIGDPNVIAERTGIPVVADFRRRDMAAGGQGAPLVPAFHAAVLGGCDHRRVVLNIGGIANLTVLPLVPGQPLLGFDTGPGNGLIDRWIERAQGAPYDAAGAWGRQGRVDFALLDTLLEESWFQKPPPKSTGREQFHLGWLLPRLANHAGVTEVDVQATLHELTARTVAEALQRWGGGVEEVVVCGGGVRNRLLWERLEAGLPGVTLRESSHYGLDPFWVEAMAFAWLARARLTGGYGNVPSVTGAQHPVVLGALYAR